MRIGIDLDDVLIDLNHSLSLFHNTQYGTNYRTDEVRSFHLEEVWNCTRDEAIRRVGEFYEVHDPQYIPAIEGAHETLNRLKKRNEFFIITGRPHSQRTKTEKTVDFHFPNIFNEIHFTDFFSKRGNALTKADICQSLTIDIFVEDNHKWAHQVAEKGIPTILMNKPWNQEPITHSNVTRVHNWKEIEQRIVNHKR